MTGSNNISSSFKTAFHAVRKANVARRTVGRPRNPNISTLLPNSAAVNFHAVGPLWTGKPTITLRLRMGESAQLYCFNLTPAIDRHRRVSRSKPSGVFLTSLNWDSILRSNMVLLSRKISQLPKEDKLPLNGPPGFADRMKKSIDILQTARYSRQFLNRFVVSDGEEPYKTNEIEISKVIANPTSEYCHDIAPTVSYICDISFNNRSEDDESSFLTEDEVTKDYDNENAVSRNALAILDCPTVSHFDEIKSNRSWTYYMQSPPQKQISAIIHLTPNEIFNSEEYRNWIGDFGIHCKHLIVNDTSPYVYSLKEYRHISKLHKLNPVLFPSVDVDNNPIPKFDDIEGNIFKVDGRMEVFLRGDSCKVVKDEWRTQEDDISLLESRWSEISDQYSSTLDKFSRNMWDLKSPNCDGYFPSISVLGSGSVHDNTLRGQPGFLLRLDEQNSILLDCGEITLERIHQMFGDSSEKILASIKLILLSHRHHDHHAGFYSMIDAIAKSGGGRQQKIFCLMPTNVQPIYRDIMGDNADFIDFCFLTNQPNQALAGHKAAEIIRTLPIKSIVPVRVDHNMLTFGIVIVTVCGKKIVYSSDTLPMSRQLIKYGNSADLLIHDCLYVESGMETEAKLRKHGYLNGAIETSNAMNAKFLLLTHFAPQYPLLPFEYLPEKYANNLSPAIDFMSVSLSDLQKLPDLVTTLEVIYKDKLTRGRARANSMYLRRVSRSAMVERFSSLFEMNS